MRSAFSATIPLCYNCRVGHSIVLGVRVMDSAQAMRGEVVCDCMPWRAAPHPSERRTALSSCVARCMYCSASFTAARAHTAHTTLPHQPPSKSLATCTVNSAT